MPTFEFTSPEGKTYTVEGPAGATHEQAFQILQGQIPKAAKPEQSTAEKIASTIYEYTGKPFNNAVMGAARGAAGIGATLMAPTDALTGNTGRRAAIDASMDTMGADKSSMAYNAGKLGTEIAGTMGVGGALGAGAGALGAAPKVVNALTSGGFNLGEKTAPGFINALKDIALRATAGGVVGGASAGAADTQNAGTGAVIGGILPPAIKGLGAAGSASSRATVQR